MSNYTEVPFQLSNFNSPEYEVGKVYLLRPKARMDLNTLKVHPAEFQLWRTTDKKEDEMVARILVTNELLQIFRDFEF